MKAGSPDPAGGELNDAIRLVRSRGLQAARVAGLPTTHRVIPARGFITRSNFPASPGSECAADSKFAFRHSAHCDHREAFHRFDLRVSESTTGRRRHVRFAHER